MSSGGQRSGRSKKRLPVWLLILIDILGTCAALGIFMFFHLILPRSREQRNLENTVKPVVTVSVPDQGCFQTEEPADPAEEMKDSWKFGHLTTDEIVITESGYSSHDIRIDIQSFDEDEGVINSPYTVADIYVRDIHCLQSYFAGGKYIPTGHGEPILESMEKSGAILATNGDYYSMQLGSGVLRNGVLYRYPVADFDVLVLYEDGSVKIFPKKTIRTEAGWEEAFSNAWQAWSFGPSLLDESGKQYDDLRANLFGVLANRNPRTGFGYFEPGHYCLVVVEGRSDTAPGATIEEFASVFESLGCVQAYNLDGGGSSVMAFNGELLTDQSTDRKLPDIILVSEYLNSFAYQESLNREMEVQP